MSDDRRAAWETFGQRRAQVATSPQGFLSLINTQWISEPQTVWGAAGTWAPMPDGESGLMVTATAEDGVEVDGHLVNGQVAVLSGHGHKASTIRFSATKTGSVIAGAQGVGLRVFDTASEDATRFSHIDSFDYDPAWALVAKWTEILGGSVVGFEHLKDDADVREEVVPGDIVLDYHGETYHLSAFKAGTALQLVFGDTTNGSETYSVGRFLFCAPQPDGTITLDFNYAVLPPCAFSYQYNCPLPPANNRLPFPVTAGEKQVIAKGGELLHHE